MGGVRQVGVMTSRCNRSGSIILATLANLAVNMRDRAFSEVQEDCWIISFLCEPSNEYDTDSEDDYVE